MRFSIAFVLTFFPMFILLDYTPENMVRRYNLLIIFKTYFLIHCSSSVKRLPQVDLQKVVQNFNIYFQNIFFIPEMLLRKILHKIEVKHFYVV